MQEVTDLPLVSIITPSYNTGRYIRKTIESVQAQTYQRFEMIIVDDGSTDDTEKTVREYAEYDKRIQYMKTENQGQSMARNTAITVAKGKYVSFLDADDLLLPEKIARQVHHLEQNPDVDISYCKIYHFYDIHPEQLYYFPLQHPSGNLFPNILASNFINPLSVVMKRELIMKFNGFEPSFRWMDEQYFWTKMAYSGARFDYLDEPLGLYRIHETNLTNRPEYLRETEVYYQRLLNTVSSWLKPEEKKIYKIEGLRKRSRQRMMIGKILAWNNPISKVLLRLYKARRKNRLITVDTPRLTP